MSHPIHSPFVEIERADWARLAPRTPNPLTEEEVRRLRGTGDRLELREVAEVYLPLSRLVSLYQESAQRLHRDTTSFLGASAQPTPFVIAVAGSVAVGKSTTARLLKELLRRWEGSPQVDLITTDGFLHPNRVLEQRGLMGRKGFPESYDRRALLGFVAKVKSGEAEVRAPVYSHLTYDIVPGEEVVVRRPDILIIEGLNVLQPPPSRAHLAVSDLFDFSIYVDARTSAIREWYVDRFFALKAGAFQDPQSYFHRFADLTPSQARAYATEVWDTINGPNLTQHILPTRSRADLVLRKAEDHTIRSVLLRKV
ncbi:type I pantothenate kinase [Agrococcus sp. SL85]|uniref:type I pantothenate kinase n=1 Tax=Agrococcus sp. SL85 TaxID=2995141 RepID=UPI00226C6684|nr:type I pantothenate kinase [Agrococcus sp. SL85]WAC66644.1 type I pantothenate kinase [Agrococcus sp. SL85]